MDGMKEDGKFGSGGSRFKIGDRVSLVSGGPPMTVTVVHPDGTVAVAWFEGHQVRRDVFHADALNGPA